MVYLVALLSFDLISHVKSKVAFVVKNARFRSVAKYVEVASVCNYPSQIWENFMASASL